MATRIKSPHHSLSIPQSAPPTVNISLPLCQMEGADDKTLEAAETLILFSLSSPDLWPRSEFQLQSLDLQHLETISSSLLPWGIRSRRSRCLCGEKRKQEEDESSVVAAAACGRPSPATPLDYAAVSVPSTSGSNGAPSSSEVPPNKRRSAGDPSAPRVDVNEKVGAVERSPVVGVAIASSKPIRRPGKKKTIAELQAFERSLLEENTNLKKRVESKRKEMVTLMAENRRLMDKKSFLQQTEPAAEAAKPLFLLPDLNKPAMET